jgi:predicted alpha/beta-hydrolase family hydrolase
MMMLADGVRDMVIAAGARAGSVDAILMIPADARALYVMGHGAGAGMRHVFMTAVAERFASRGIGTLRYQFPYTQRGESRPDPGPVLQATVRAAVACARTDVPHLPLFAGGKSMGGRMTSLAAADQALPVSGIVFFGFPLHNAHQPATARAAHLANVQVPMLFLQGTRDALAELRLLQPVCASLERATIHIVDGADHGFHVLKRSGRNDEQVLDELADVASKWMLMMSRKTAGV